MFISSVFVGVSTPSQSSQSEPSAADAAVPEMGEDLSAPPSGLHPHLDVFDHADVTEHYLRPRPTTSSGDPGARCGSTQPGGQ